MNDLFQRLKQVSDPCLVTRTFKDDRKELTKYSPEMKELLYISGLNCPEETSESDESESEIESD